MKNKKIIYILLPLVILIWGMIFMRIISRVRNSNRIISQSTVSFSDKTKQELQDTIILQLNYRDPFLGSSAYLQKSGNNELSMVRTSLSSAAPTFKFPALIYSGLVTNPKSKKKTGLLKINQKDYLVREGEILEGLKIGKLYTDSAILIHGTLRRSALKKNSIRN